MSPRPVLSLVHAWLLLDFFESSRRGGRPGSALTTTIFTQSFLGLVLAALLFPDTPATAYLAANLTLSTLLVGLGAFGDPGRGSRLHADRQLLTTAPLSKLARILAAALHGGFHVALVTIGVALPGAILAYWTCGHRPAAVPAYLAVATLLAGSISAAANLALAVSTRFLGDLRAQALVGLLKAVLLGGGFVGFALCLSRLRGTAGDLPVARWLVTSWPPYWGARWIAGSGGAADLARLLALPAALLLLHALAAGAPRRARVLAARPGPLTRLATRLAAPGRLRALTELTGTMLTRSPAFRGRLLPLLGMPVAMALLPHADDGSGFLWLAVILQLPAIYVPFLVAFLPYSDQSRVAWIFAAAPGTTAEVGAKAALLAVAVCILSPLMLAAGVFVLIQGAAPFVAASLALFAWSTAVATTAVQARSLSGPPFSADQADESVSLDFGGLVVLAFALTGLGAGYALIADRPAGLAAGLAVATASVWLLRRAARDA